MKKTIKTTKANMERTKDPKVAKGMGGGIKLGGGLKSKLNPLTKSSGFTKKKFDSPSKNEGINGKGGEEILEKEGDADTADAS